MKDLKKLIAKDLLSIKAVFFRPDQPFTWASGIKSPVYCDNRLTLTAPAVRDDVENGLAQLIKEKRLQYSKKLLKTTNYSIAEVSEKIGFSDYTVNYLACFFSGFGGYNHLFF